MPLILSAFPIALPFLAMFNLKNFSLHASSFLVLFVSLIWATSSQAVVRFGNPPVAVTNTNEDYLRFVRHITVHTASQNGATWEAGNNIIDKTPAEVQDIVNAIKALEHPVLRQMFDDMQAVKAINGQSDDFDFVDVEEAKSSVLQRVSVVHKMRDFNVGKENSPYWYGPPGTTAPKWQMGRRGLYETSRGRMLLNNQKLYRQKSGTPYEAILELCSQPYRTGGECWGAAAACVWWSSAQAMGPARFNALYPTPEGLDMDPYFSNGWERNLRASVDTSRMVYGDWVYWKNHNYGEVIANQAYFNDNKPNAYLSNTGDYIYQGENAFYIGHNAEGKDVFEGLGLPNLTADQMKETLQFYYNRDLQPLINARKIEKIDDNDRNRLIVLQSHKRLVQ